MKNNNMEQVIVDVNDVSHVSSGSILKGEISSLNDLRIDGTVEGKVFSKGKIVVGENAKVTGTLVCGNLDLGGRMEGDVYVREFMSLKGTASIDGNVNVNSFQVEIGGRINGNFHMINDADFEKFVADLVDTPAPGYPA